MHDDPSDTLRERLEAFYRAHHRALAAYALSCVRSRDEAEDLVHEALASILAARAAQIEPIAVLEAYAYRAIRTRAIDRARRARTAIALHERSAVSPRHTSCVVLDGEDARISSDRETLEDALASLAPAAAEVVVLHTRWTWIPADCTHSR